MPGTVTVGCKLPNGLYIQAFTMESHQEAVMGGGWKEINRAVAKGERIKLNGCARFAGKDAPHEIRNGVGLTFGVDADLFAAWLEQNKDNEIVKNGLVFAQAKTGEINAQAKDHRTLKSGLEPLDPKNLPAEFKGKIETAQVGA